MKQIESKIRVLWILAVSVAMTFTSCSDDDNGPGKDPTQTTKDLAENIVGYWLASGSSETEWITYQFTASSRVNAEWKENGRTHSGSGFYSVVDKKVSGDYTSGGKVTYFDWVVENSATFEIGYKLYDNNTFLGNASIYRILTEKEIEEGISFTPDYRKLCDTNDVSGFSSLDDSIATVDQSTGKITGAGAGTTFIVFKTPYGSAAVKVIVERRKGFAELLVGTWIYDNLAEKEWQKTTFTSDGFAHVEWTLGVWPYLDESADGHYTIDGDRFRFTVKTNEGVSLTNVWETLQINDFVWTYRAFDGSGASVGAYTGQRLLSSVTLKPGSTETPDYASIAFGKVITGYDAHNPSVAVVDKSTGKITAKAKGRTYVDVVTQEGSGVVEVIVEG